MLLVGTPVITFRGKYEVAVSHLLRTKLGDPKRVVSKAIIFLALFIFDHSFTMRYFTISKPRTFCFLGESSKYPPSGEPGDIPSSPRPRLFRGASEPRASIGTEGRDD